jgi:hypothetical protein
MSYSRYEFLVIICAEIDLWPLVGSLGAFLCTPGVRNEPVDAMRTPFRAIECDVAPNSAHGYRPAST